ncbi:hypothetical protein AX16_009618 [Volvariella volvacea WC 439]|nr:hypothetical protein AX16_009618 [Volvariella volvacea WC 439]
MFLVDWINRPDFEKHARKVLRGRDLQDIASYYSHPGSGFWILEKGSYLVGLIALDSEPNATDNSVEVKVPRIRHFYVEEAYRGVGVQSDLLQHVLKFAFDHGGVQEIRVVASPLLPYIQRCLSAAGFTEEGYPDEPMGILKWRLTYKYSKERVVVHDLSDRIPGYDEQPEPIQEVLRLLDDVPSTLPVDVIIDSVDALITNFNPLSDSYVKLREILLITLRHPRPSRLVIHLNQECPLLPLIIQRSFSPISLAHFIAYPASLINYISTSYLTDPPPLSAQEKFWAVFVPLSERRREIMRIVHDPNGAGPNPREFVIELTIRGNAASRKDRNVSRYLEGWSIDQNGPCKLSELESCNPIWSKRHAMETPDSIPSHGVSFNLELTEAQQQSRARVPLPYAHEGE